MLEKNVKNKMDRVTNDEVFQRVKEERLLLNMLKKIDTTRGQGIQLGITSLW